jgi:hypothetical protein
MPNPPIRAFISHAHQDKHQAGALKDGLKDMGIEAFVAHDDIMPSSDWQRAILDALRASDIFLPLLTPEFSNSKWTDQETGIAVANGTFIVPLGLGQTPYGFIGKYQALNCSRGIDAAALDKLFSAVVTAQPSWKPRLIEAALERLRSSRGFDLSNQVIGRLRQMEPLDVAQLNSLCKIWLTNNQVEHAYDAKDCITRMITERSGEIDAGTLTAIRAKLA